MTPENPVTERILKDPNVVWDVADDALVIAMKDQLLVSGSVRRAVQELDIALSEVAEEIGTLADINVAIGRPATITPTRGGRKCRAGSSTWSTTSRSGG